MKAWSSEQYLKFQDERTQPARELAARIRLAGVFSAVDLGCGPGNSTNVLCEVFPQASVTGVDSSDDMLERARSAYPKMMFARCVLPDDIGSLPKSDLLFSNACLHWIPHHERLFPQLMDKLNEGGVLAVQMPLVQRAPFYQALGNLVLKDKWSRLRKVRNFHNLTPEQTYDILAKCSSCVTMWEIIYYHIVPSYESVIEWYKGSGLRPYLALLDDREAGAFTEELLGTIKACFEARTDGNVILKMPRLFFIAKK